MEIPRYWAEHREQRTLAGRSVTLRRFGWSSASQEHADRHAVARVAEAWAAWDSGRKPTRREQRVAYGGDGLPIREEVVSEHPDCGAVVTRNAYGARCLNVADVLFADVDLGEPARRGSELRWLAGGFLVLLAILGGFAFGRGPVHVVPAVGFGAVALMALAWLPAAWRRWRWASDPGAVLSPVRRWCASHPSWRLRVYRTPAGLRLLATHAALAPRGSEADAFFRFVRTDRLYHIMCVRQDCFRARVSPKPWRIGIGARMGSSSWPVRQDAALLRRVAWVEDYEAKSQGFAACELLEEIGTGAESSRGRAVRELHDRLCQVGRGLPLA